MRSINKFHPVTYALIALLFVSCCVVTKGKNVFSEKSESQSKGQHIKGTIEYSALRPSIKVTKNKRLVIKHDYDLNGLELVLDEGYTLDFYGGSFRNGCITGNKTRIIYHEKPIFDSVSIKGSWIVERITTDMFENLNYSQSLADVLALTDSEINNQVIIKDYGYNYELEVTSLGMFDAPLKLKSNTDLQLDGNIKLRPTNLFQYVIMMIGGCQNVNIYGNGSITGDRVQHDYSIADKNKAWKTHEWGHGVRIANSQNVSISGISVNDCTGDSFNIIEGSQDILLDGVNANGSRRQGVTIGVASKVTINNCKFINIGRLNGTAPGAAVDIEPDNMECEIKDIVVERCEIQNCSQGIISWSYGYGNTWTSEINGKKMKQKDGRHYVNLTIENCRIDGAEYAFSLYGWDKAIIRGCKVSNSKYFAKYPKNTTFENNDIESDYLMINWARLSNCALKNNNIKIKNQSVIRLHESQYVGNKSDGNGRIIVQDN